MLKETEIINKKFGRMTIKKFLGYCIYSYKNFKNKSYCPYVLCICECGKEKSVLYSSLLNGATKSCGCLNKEVAKINGFKNKKLTNYQRLLNQVFQYKNLDARKRNLEMLLTIQQVENIIFKNCYYCNSLPSNICKLTNCGQLYYSGIDRVDNTKGYILDNCVPCCITCNTMKSFLSLHDFKNHLIKINKYFLNK